MKKSYSGSLKSGPLFLIVSHSQDVKLLFFWNRKKDGLQKKNEKHTIMKKAYDAVKDRFIMYWWGAGGPYVTRKAQLKAYRKEISKLQGYVTIMERDLKKDDEDIEYFLKTAKQ